MGRHGPRTAGRRRRVARVATLTAALVVLVAAGAGFAVRPDGVRFFDRVRAAAAPGCAPTTVRLAASPAITPSIRTALTGIQGRSLADGTCLRVDVQGVAADQVVATARTAGAGSTDDDLGRLPQLWVPDSALWAERTPDAVPVRVEGSLARSPVVLTTSAATLRDLGWDADAAPPWAQAVTGVRPVAVDLTTDTCGLATAFALRAAVGEGLAYRRALAALSLAVDHAAEAGLDAPLDLAATNSPRTPLIPESEQTVLSLRRSGLAALRLVYPRDGSVFLDFPLVRVAPGRWNGAVEAATASVVSALRSTRAAAAFTAQGFRLPGSPTPDGDGVRTGPIRALPVPNAAGVGDTVKILTKLSAPTRMLALIDISTSMDAEVAPGMSRIALVRDAATVALTMLPAQDSVGAWVFASRLRGEDVDWRPIADVAPLDAVDQGVSHRERILEVLRQLPDTTVDGGTSIFDTVDAAVQAMQSSYDPRAGNVVVLLTDGANVDSRGLTLDEVVERLSEGGDRGAVRLIAIGIGPSADLKSLERLAAATPGGHAYQARNPRDLQEVLLDALATRA